VRKLRGGRGPAGGGGAGQDEAGVSGGGQFLTKMLGCKL